MLKTIMIVVLLALTTARGLFAAPAAKADGCSSQASGWVARENSKAGSEEWNEGVPFRLSADFSRRKAAKRIEGYFNATSIQCGGEAAITLVGAAKAIATV
jgi:predicted NAD/FAD-dependent oxidoreductase